MIARESEGWCQRLTSAVDQSREDDSVRVAQNMSYLQLNVALRDRR